MSVMSIAKGLALDKRLTDRRLTLPAFLAQAALAYADREALVFYEDESRISWTYRELLAEAEAVAKALTTSGIGHSSRVGLLATNRPEWVSTFFGIGLAGGIAVPLSTFSTADELAYLIEASAIAMLIMEPRVANNDLLASLVHAEPAIADLGFGTLRSTRFPYLRKVVLLGDPSHYRQCFCYQDFLASGVDVDADYLGSRSAHVEASDLGAIFFSSGSTSAPKGVMNAHRGMVLQFYRQADLLGLTDSETVRAWGPNGFFWSGNCAQVLGAAMVVGGTNVLQSRFDPESAIALMERERVTYPQAWPHQWAQLEAAPNWLGAQLGSLHFFDRGKIVADHPAITTDWTEPRWSYGSTETFTASTGFPARSPQDVARDSHGIPLPGNTVKIVDPLSGSVLPLGELGEIAIKGPTLMLGYLGTALGDTLDENGFFRTGDSGYLDADGRLFWEGRLSDIIKTGGANVSPLEIDEAIARHAAVKASKTVGVPHRTLGEMVVSCVVLHANGAVDEAELVAYLKTRLSGYKVPRRVLIFDEDEFSYTGSSKIKADGLRERARQKLEA